MIEVLVPNIGANRAIEIVSELRAIGWQQGQDFDFAYHQAEYDTEYHMIKSRGAVFTFYTEEYSSYFTLRWA